MALDGAYLSLLKKEIETRAIGARVERINQPSREEIVISLRMRSGNTKLFMSARGNSPRINFTDVQLENPKTPPMFCMFLRKHLGSAKLVGVRQQGMDRILYLDFEAINELGDLVTITIVLEIMGRYSNLIIVDQNGKILECLKKVTDEVSSVRQVLPGMTYCLPPMQDKLILTDVSPEQILERLKKGRAIPLSKALMETIQGVSPILCREISFYAARGLDPLAQDMEKEEEDRLCFKLNQVADILRGNKGTPTMVIGGDGKPKDFSFLPITQYGHTLLTREYENYSALLDSFYSERDRIERMRQRSHDLLRLLANQSDRAVRKVALQKEELRECKDRDYYKLCGDLINANLYQLQKGMGEAKLPNYFVEGCPTIAIKLDPLLTPSQNAQHYYREYRKAVTAEKMLTDLILQGEEEVQYLDSVFDLLTRATTQAELSQIREELITTGYIKRYHGKKMKPEKLSYKRYRSDDGFTILVGRNNLQNDQLTMKDAHNYDIWFHTQKIPGSHTVIVTEGKEVPDRTLEQAAIIAAYHSKAGTSAKVNVDYTIIKNVKKPPAAKPGRVIYDKYKTAVVDPDEMLVKRLEI